MLKTVTRIGYKLFGKYIHRHYTHFKPLADCLKTARMLYTVEEYVSGVVLLSIVSFTVFFIISFGVLYVVGKSSILVSFLVSLFVAVAASGVVWAFLMNYPNFVIKKRGEDINSRLAFTVTHMATLAGTGVSPIVIFKALTKFSDYGEISKECAYIVRDVELFGKDLYTAISDAARHSPSKLWSEILWGIVSTLRSGGDLRAYLSEKAQQLVELYEREEKKAVETLNIITEIFMVVFVVGPVIGVIIVVFMGMLGGGLFGVDLKLFLMFFIYFVLPAIGIGFLIVGEMSKPKEVF